MYLILKRFTAKEEENKKVWQAKLEGKDGRTGFKVTTTVEAPDKEQLKEIVSGSVGSLYNLDLDLVREGNGSTLEDFDLYGEVQDLEAGQ